MWIIDRVRRLFGTHESVEVATHKTPPEDFRAPIDKADVGPFNPGEPNRGVHDQPIETLDVTYEEGTPLPAQGILKDMGYRVGKNGLSLAQRRQILHRTFQVQLVAPLTMPTDYIAEWGDRCSYARFTKMDKVLGGLAAKAERKTKNDMSEAIRNWREDQAWLRQTYRDWMDHNH